MLQSVARQRASVQEVARQGKWVSHNADLPAGSCPPMDFSQLEPHLDRIAIGQRLDPELLAAIIGQESSFRPCAVSSKGAVGLMQLMPATIEEYRVGDPFDPIQNVESGARYLRSLLDRYGGDLAMALAAYNAGPAEVDSAKGIPDFPETLRYVSELMNKLAKPSAAAEVAPNSP
jgi:soluble lytic murein transglycosylase-like protein